MNGSGSALLMHVDGVKTFYNATTSITPRQHPWRSTFFHLRRTGHSCWMALIFKSLAFRMWAGRFIGKHGRKSADHVGTLQQHNTKWGFYLFIISKCGRLWSPFSGEQLNSQIRIEKEIKQLNVLLKNHYLLRKQRNGFSCYELI